MNPKRIRPVGESHVPLNDDFTKAVAFITSPDVDENHDPTQRLTGTTFIISMAEDGGEHWYLVTAAHVVRQIAGESFVRLNLRAGGVEHLPIDRWVFHPDYPTDVAVTPFSADPNIFDFRTIPVSAFVDDNRLGFRPALGDVVHFLGLFSKVAEMGKQNVPMARFGTIGAIDQNGVPLELGPGTIIHIAAHLIDCHAYRGFSGAPVFVQRPEVRPVRGTVMLRGGETRAEGVALGATTLLIGVHSGHFDIKEKADVGEMEAVEVPVNSGVGVVTPSRHILETLEEPELVEDRRERTERRMKSRDSGATLDGRFPPES